VKVDHLIAKAALLVLGLAVTTAALAKESPITIRLKAFKGQIATFYRGQKLTDSKLAQLCVAHRLRKDEINFQRDKMSSADTVTALLKEADCLGAKRAGVAGTDQHPAAQKSLARKHAKQPRTKGKPQ
jgi:hypothetical protein